MLGASAVVPSAQLSPRSAARSTESLRGRPRKSETPDAIQGFSLFSPINTSSQCVSIEKSCIVKKLAITSEPGERTDLDLPLPQIPRSCPPLESSV